MSAPPPGQPLLAAADAASERTGRFGRDLIPAEELYGRALAAGGGLLLRGADGQATILPLDRWLGEPTRVDHGVLDRAEGPVLDVGCGPGRHVAALAERGTLALGVDVTPAAVAAARGRGAAVLEASVFDRLPTHWATALLLDGNVGIGGAPGRLLRHVGELLAPGGRLLVEVDPPGTPSGPVDVRLEHDGAHSGWFRWARVALDAVDDPAAAAGLEVAERWSDGGRHFVRLDRPAAP